MKRLSTQWTGKGGRESVGGIDKYVLGKGRKKPFSFEEWWQPLSPTIHIRAVDGKGAFSFPSSSRPLAGCRGLLEGRMGE